MFAGKLVQDKHTRIWQMRYYVEGDSAHSQSRSAKTTKRSEAKTRLDKFIQQLNSGVSVDLEKVTVGDLVRTYIDWQKTQGKKDWEKTEQRWLTHLKSTFSDVKAIHLNTRMLVEFVTKRLGEEIVIRSRCKSGKVIESHTGKLPTGTTINLDLATLRGAYCFAKKDTQFGALVVPSFPTLPKGKARTDRLHEMELRRLIEATTKAGVWFQTLILVWSSYAWRRSEAVERLTVLQVNMEACADGEVVPRGKLMLDDSKNGEPRSVYLTRQLRPLIAACIAGKASRRESLHPGGWGTDWRLP